jgi:hypothetical protein
MRPLENGTLAQTQSFPPSDNIFCETFWLFCQSHLAHVDMLYCLHMAEKNIKSILEHVDEWPHEAQEELMRSVTEIETRYRKIYHVSDDERAALERSAEDVRDGRFANDRQVAEAFGRHRRA